MKNIRGFFFFFSENLHILVAKFSVYLNRHAFVMQRVSCNWKDALSLIIGSIVFRRKYGIRVDIVTV